MTTTRRAFVGGLTAASYGRVRGANDRVQVGLVGAGLIGTYHIGTFRKQPDVDVAAVCDVYQPRVEAGIAAAGGRAKPFRDFRKMLEDKEVQAVIVATPDHWHALMTILACAAGKDVYVEKPMTLFVREGRWMTNAARRYNRIVQVGTQGRSAGHIPEVVALFQSQHIGKVHKVHIATARNIMPGFGAPADGACPRNLDYDMWLGPAPQRPYNLHRALYHFRWFWDYSGGQMTNLGAHDLDFVYLLMNTRGPSSVFSAGGRLALSDDNGETPDTQDAILQYRGFNVTISIREASGGRRQGGGTEFFGTKGSMTIGRNGYQVWPDQRIAPQKQIPPWSDPPGHPQPVAVEPGPRTEARKSEGEAEPMERHVRNFIDSVKSRKRPNADVEDGHLVATACHLANISLRLGRPVRWDPVKEEIVGDAEASRWIERPYRKPWDGVLRGMKL
ncbi:MAG: Gfo/Idh/MocA family protein [Bryobacteraceae bacterium]